MTIFKKQNSIVVITMVVSLLVRIYLSQFDGYKNDVNDFKLWSQAVYNVGVMNFYSSIWSDYPPFYIYILWIAGAVYKLFSVSFDINTVLFTVLIKLPANIFDIFTSLLILTVLRKYAGFKTAYAGMALYAFNPAIMYNSAVWGQVDSVNTFFILLAITLMVSDKLELAGVSLAIAILTKPQSLVILPFIAVLMISDLVIKKQKPIRLAKIFIISVFAFLALALPFYLKNPYQIINQLIKIYTSGYSQYAYNSMNAFNFWALFGFWKPDDTVLLILSYRIWGYIVYILLFIYVVKCLIIRNKDGNKDKLIYFASAILFFGFFMFFTRIHERYLFPMFAPLVIATGLDKRLKYALGILIFTFLFNLYFVLQYLNSGQFIPDGNPYVLATSSMNLGIFIYLLYCFSNYRPGN